MKMQIDSLPSGIRQVTLVGRLDIEGTSQIEDKFAFAVPTEKTPVLVDMSLVDFIASIGMRLLLTNAKALSRRGGKLAIFRPQPLVREALSTAGIDMLIPVYDDLDTASAALLQTPSAA